MAIALRARFECVIFVRGLLFYDCTHKSQLAVLCTHAHAISLVQARDRAIDRANPEHEHPRMVIMLDTIW